MLTDLCQELRNWFDRNQPKWYGEFKIENGALVLRDDMSLKDGQYFRIVGSALNDGVYQYGSLPIAVESESGGSVSGLSFGIEEGRLIQSTEGAVPHYHYRLEDETFTGAVWAMAVPPSVIALSDEIDEWISKYSDVVQSPYQSESFGGYTYSKSYNSAINGSNTQTWASVFKDKLNRWRKI